MSFKTTFTLSEVYNKQLSGIWPTAFYDYFEKTSLLIGTNETTFITDASTNKWALTPLASVNLLKAKNEHPYQPGYYSTFFATSADYVTTSAIFMSATAFTVECWVNTTNKTAYAGICKNGAAAEWTVTDIFVIGLDSSGNSIFIYNGTGALSLNGTMTVTDGKWHHIALVYDGTNYKLYIDGILNASQALAAMSQTARVHNIGSDIRNSRSWVGHISNFRIVNGTALYSSNFVPPTSPLTAIPGTAILTCMDSYHAERITPFTRSVAGVPSIRTFTPFSSSIPSIYSSYGSANINNSSLNNTAFTGANFGTSADFTIESWMKWGATTASNHTSYEFNGTTRTIIGRSSTGLRLYLTGTEKGFAYTFIPNVWYHIAIVRSLLTYYVYINGVLATAAFTHAGNHSYTTLTIGRNFDTAEIAVGLSLSDFRIVNGTAVYGGNFIPPTAPLTAIRDTTLLTFQNDKEIANSTFYDDSSMKNLLTVNGTPTQGTVSPISANGWSGSFNGSSDFLTAPANSALSMGTGDFTWEMWIYPTSSVSTNGMLFGYRSGSNTSPFLFYSTTQIIFGDDSANIITYTGVPPIGSWTHIAVSRAGTALKMFINGIVVGSATNSTNFSDASLRYVGAMNTTSPYYFPGHISNLRIVKGIAVYTTSFTPPTAPLTAIPGTVLLALQDNRFKDNSLSNNALTVTGTPKIQPFSPFYPSQKTIGTTVDYVGNSTYFNGSTDYLSTPSGIASFGSGSTAYAFTAEAWFNTSAPATDQTVISKYASGSSGWAIRLNASKLIVYLTGDSTTIVGTTTLVAGTWYHVALSGSPGNWKLFLNGVQEGATQTSSVTLGDGAAIQIGRVSNVVYFIGYIASVRVVLSVIVYTTNFTPPTAPLTAIPGTILLTCQDSLFKDLSGNSVVITVAGTPKISPVTPFTTTTSTQYDIIDNGSMYFNGTNDYVGIPSSPSIGMGTFDFTVEGWIYPTASSQFTLIAMTGNSIQIFISSLTLYWYNSAIGQVSGGTIVLNAWQHIAFSRNNGVVRGFLNGVQVISVATATDFAAGTAEIGRNGTNNGGSFGYISSVRVIKGIGLYIAPFTPSTVLRDVPGTVLLLKGNNAGIYDATGRNNLITVGDAKTSQVIKKYGNNSMYFDGTGDYISILAQPNFNFGTGDFTIEGWAYTTTVATAYQAIISQRSGDATATVGWSMQFATNTFTTNFTNGTTAYSIVHQTTIAVNTWYHVALVKSGTSVNIYLNGIASSSPQTVASTYAVTGSGTTVYVGYASSGSAISPFNGYIDDLRITKGVARYITSFTPPPRLGLVP